MREGQVSEREGQHFAHRMETSTKEHKQPPPPPKKKICLSRLCSDRFKGAEGIFPWRENRPIGKEEIGRLQAYPELVLSVILSPFL